MSDTTYKDEVRKDIALAKIDDVLERQPRSATHEIAEQVLKKMDEIKENQCIWGNFRLRTKSKKSKRI